MTDRDFANALPSENSSSLKLQIPREAAEFSAKRGLIFHTLDGMRGIAALLVVAYHTTRVFGTPPVGHGYLAVDLFFLLSGVVICKSYEQRLRSVLSFRQFAVTRLIRLYPLYALGCLVSIVVIPFGLGWGANYTALEATFLSVLALMFLPNPIIGHPIHLYPMNHPAWSLFHELVANAFYALFLRYLTNRAIALLLAVSWVGIVLAVYRLPDHSLNIGFTIKSVPFGILRTFFSFFTGVLLYRFYAARDLQPAMSGLLGSVVTIILLFLLAATLLAQPTAFNGAYDILCVTLIFPLLVVAGLVCQPSGWVQRLCALTGSVSYAIYAIHGPIVYVLDTASRRYRWGLDEGHRPFQLIFILALVILGLALERSFDLPARRWLSRAFGVKKGRA